MSRRLNLLHTCSAITVAHKTKNVVNASMTSSPNPSTSWSTMLLGSGSDSAMEAVPGQRQVRRSPLSPTVTIPITDCKQCSGLGGCQATRKKWNTGSFLHTHTHT
eukprot:scpid103382/ scgid24745/ 